MKVALVYDRVNKFGGAERVLLSLHKIFPNAPLYTSVYDKDKTPWAKDFEIKTSFLQNIPFSMHHELFATLMPVAFESFIFDDFDLVISVTSESAKGIITKEKTKHICYCLTPTRYLWSGYDEYFKNPVLKFISQPAISYLKTWDKIASKRPDKFIAISKEVKGRINKYYGRDSAIVYPSVELINNKIKTQKNKKYFLIVSRLVSYKRIDLAIKAFNKLKLPLKIVGDGSEMNKLKSISGPTIEFVGHLTDEELVRYYSECLALVFPGIEDFGLTILEAQSFGKPVIAFGNAGALETIIDGKTGVFFDRQEEDSVIDAVLKFSKMNFRSEDCIEQTKKFSFERFKKEFLKEII